VNDLPKLRTGLCLDIGKATSSLGNTIQQSGPWSNAGFTYGKVPAKVLGWTLVVTGVWGFLPAVYLALSIDLF